MTKKVLSEFIVRKTMKKINIVCALSAAALLIMGCEKNEYDDGPGNPGQGFGSGQNRLRNKVSRSAERTVDSEGRTCRS